MSPITTHVLDTARGQPAAGIAVKLEYRGRSGNWEVLAESRTDNGGRVQDLLPGDHHLKPGRYCLRFETSVASPFFPEIAVQFEVDDPGQHYHVPLLLGPYGYTTYRGS